MTSSPSIRYFYSDPLAASWMEKHYAMAFILEEYYTKSMVPAGYDEFDFDGSKFRTSVSTYCLRDGHHPGKIFVHPDSLHLLDPRAGDMVTNIGMSGWRVTKVEGERVFCAHDYYGKKSEVSIIQRNGKVFFWPESQAA